MKVYKILIGMIAIIFGNFCYSATEWDHIECQSSDEKFNKKYENVIEKRVDGNKKTKEIKKNLEGKFNNRKSVCSGNRNEYFNSDVNPIKENLTLMLSFMSMGSGRDRVKSVDYKVAVDGLEIGWVHGTNRNDLERALFGCGQEINYIQKNGKLKKVIMKRMNLQEKLPHDNVETLNAETGVTFKVKREKSNYHIVAPKSFFKKLEDEYSSADFYNEHLDRVSMPEEPRVNMPEEPKFYLVNTPYYKIIEGAEECNLCCEDDNRSLYMHGTCTGGQICGDCAHKTILGTNTTCVFCRHDHQQ